MSYTVSNIATIINANILQLSKDEFIDEMLFDSRRLIFPGRTVFFALSGPRRLGQDFMDELYQKGVRSFVVDPHFDQAFIHKYPKANILQVNNVLLSIQKIASCHRDQFDIPVVGVTGSNGKTIIKEWLFQLLHTRFNIIRSPKSYNSQIGVPLSVWQVKPHHTLGIFEAGISQVGEMQRLESIIKPSVGILSYMGDAHAEGFTNFQQKIEEKLLLFSHSKKLVYCNENPFIEKAVKEFIKKSNTKLSAFSWGKSDNSDLCIRSIIKNTFNTTLSCHYKGGDFSFTIPFTDDASVFNALSCCATLLLLNVDIEFIQQSMLSLRPVAMRLELKKGIHQCFVINDSYSADIDSLKIALDFLSQQEINQKRTLILSDFLESSMKDEDLYKQLSTIISQKQMFRFVGVGKNMMLYKHFFSNINNICFFSSTDELLRSGLLMSLHQETILLKGARIFEFEKISLALEEKIHDTVLEINLTAVRNNLKKYQKCISPNVKMMAMVKAFSYGSGTHEIPALLQQEGIDYLAVAYTDEAVDIRKAGIQTPIMVMNTTAASFENIVQYKLEPEIYSLQIFAGFLKFLQSNQITKYPIHLKLDTGMHRLGFMQEEIPMLIEQLHQNDSILVKSVFSHLVASEQPSEDVFTENQKIEFLNMSSQIETAIGYKVMKHLANSAAILRHPSMQLDMVRLGIGLYGIDNDMTLDTVSTLKTTIAQIKYVKKGDSVGYGRKAILDKDTLVATVRLGYADGYSRVFGNGNGKMMLNGKLVPVIGNVCMDMTMIDITGLDANEGDEVIVFGVGLSIRELAKWANTIPYEIMTGVSQRVKRVFFEE